MPNCNRHIHNSDILLLKMEGKLTEKEVKIKMLERDINSFKKLLNFVKFVNFSFLFVMNIVALTYLNCTIEFCIIYTYIMLFLNYFYIYKLTICISENETNLVYLKSGLNLNRL